MNNDFNDIGRRMPYAESEEYLNQLMERVTANAIVRKNDATSNGRHRLRWAAAAAILVALGTSATLWFQLGMTDSEPASDLSPIAQFLDELDDEDAELLAYYEIEEIPEY